MVEVLVRVDHVVHFILCDLVIYLWDGQFAMAPLYWTLLGELGL